MLPVKEHAAIPVEARVRLDCFTTKYNFDEYSQH
jgi:hypothetical protein